MVNGIDSSNHTYCFRGDVYADEGHVSELIDRYYLNAVDVVTDLLIQKRFNTPAFNITRTIGGAVRSCLGNSNDEVRLMASGIESVLNPTAFILGTSDPLLADNLVFLGSVLFGEVILSVMHDAASGPRVERSYPARQKECGEQYAKQGGLQ